MSLQDEIGFYGWPDQETWYDSLEPGHEVIVTGLGEPRKMKVKSRTPQGRIRLENGDIYPRWCQIIVGPQWIKRIRPVTDSEHDELERQVFLKRLREANLEDLPLERLRKLVGLLERGRK